MSATVRINIPVAGTGLALRCPRCEHSLYRVSGTRAVCSHCNLSIPCENGIWRGILPERAGHFEQFIREYEFVRSKEGRGSSDAAYYLNLPYSDHTDRNAAQWKIRGTTFRYIEDRILPAIIRRKGHSPSILDLGAGNCWLSYRLLIRGYRPVAVDLLTNEADGLGAATFFRGSVPELFPRFQAELDRLPFADNQFDMAIFNASFHYSEDFARTLGESIRCLRPGGSVIIADTAWYSNPDSGLRMVAERRQAFRREYGFASDSLCSLEFMTDARLTALEREFGIRWQIYRPFYGWRWHLRPLLAKLRGTREPSRFRIYVAEVRK
ncbi:MAG TPA: class I SAM-dependent methyltransferase [Terriglobales bacterium]|nr:class I SAM-dependent methyltransferase [Terriglobales bacterium]